MIVHGKVTFSGYLKSHTQPRLFGIQLVYHLCPTPQKGNNIIKDTIYSEEIVMTIISGIAHVFISKVDAYV